MSKTEEGKFCAILSWFFPIGLIWFFIDEKLKKNKFAKFHVKQSLILAIASIIINVVGGIIPIIGWFIIIPVGNLIVFIFWIIGLISAIQGTEKELPIVGKYADKLNF